nr:hypothetical protein CFP56_65541 [Quercus suber]
MPSPFVRSTCPGTVPAAMRALVDTYTRQAAKTSCRQSHVSPSRNAKSPRLPQGDEHGQNKTSHHSAHQNANVAARAILGMAIDCSSIDELEAVIARMETVKRGEEIRVSNHHCIHPPAEKCAVAAGLCLRATVQPPHPLMQPPLPRHALCDLSLLPWYPSRNRET